MCPIDAFQTKRARAHAHQKRMKGTHQVLASVSKDKIGYRSKRAPKAVGPDYDGLDVLGLAFAPGGIRISHQA